MEEACEDSFFACIADAQCEGCVNELESSDLDLLSLASDETCQDVTGILHELELCLDLVGAGSLDLFCDMFDDCEQEAVEDDDEREPEGDLDCDTLTECDWEGIRSEVIGGENERGGGEWSEAKFKGRTVS